jgi:phosphoglucosamine mutase
MYPQQMINVPLAPGQDWQTHPGLLAARRQVEAELAGRGRVLIRASGTEPKLRLMVEAEEAGLAMTCAQNLASSLSAG